jgi:pantetheine-phosphate adenylyltransferase
LETKLVCFPGSFDPITLGHVEAIKHLLTIYPKIHVVTANNDAKNHLFTLDQRLKMLSLALSSLNVSIGATDQYLTNYLEEKGITTIVRTYRNDVDKEYEQQLKDAYIKLNNKMQVDLRFFDYQGLSSSIVREYILDHNEKYKAYLTTEVGDYIQSLRTSK